MTMRLSLLQHLPLAIILLIGASNLSWNFSHKLISEKEAVRVTKNEAKATATSTLAAIYDSLSLDDMGLSDKAFQYAVQGYEKLKAEGKLKNTSVITIVDFDQPSYKKRMYVIDVANYKVLFNTWSAHGKNTGQATADHFSNTPESHKSSLGFFVTNNTYYGSKGYSLRLTGLEQNVNHNALARAIVLHGAPYVSQSFINARGYIGRSHGCPAVPQELNRPIIDKIKDGSLMFIYNKAYQPSQEFQLS